MDEIWSAIRGWWLSIHSSSLGHSLSHITYALEFHFIFIAATYLSYYCVQVPETREKPKSLPVPGVSMPHLRSQPRRFQICNCHFQRPGH